MKVEMNSVDKISLNFIPEKYKEQKDDRFAYRNKKMGKIECRNLMAHEIEILVKNNNFAEDWNEILVTELFDPNLVKNCELFGRITIGKLEKVYLEYHDLRLPVGLYNSTIISCDIGDNVTIRNVRYLSHYIVSNKSILFNIDEMITTSRAKFGNGILKEDEDESIRIWLEICNENEGRKILPFDNIIPADAYIWSRNRNDTVLMDRLKELTCDAYDDRYGYYGYVGPNSVVKNCSIIKDVIIGEYSYVKGANKIKNVTIHSSKEEPSQIGEGVELVNGIVGYGCKIFYGSKAIRFITGRNTQLKYGARLLNSVLGDNSTVSCCELLNNLIFPFHEQHHNTSFLVAATLLGQSNIAAGATIGSNHNSRSADGEIIAGRGFWPGLCTDFKHNCRFASFVLIAKGSYNYELNIEYPFALVMPGKNEERITVMPAYWFMHNMYAITRNLYKFKRRDKRKIKIQHIEIDYLAPDTVTEIIQAIDKLTYMIGRTLLFNEKKDEDFDKSKILETAKLYMSNKNCKEIVLTDNNAMKRFGAQIVKPIHAIQSYKDMCTYFAIKNILSNIPEDVAELNIEKYKKIILENYDTKLYLDWKNLGGQIVPGDEVSVLINKIKTKSLNSWEEIHYYYDDLWLKYPEQKMRYALYVLEYLYNKKITDFNNHDWNTIYIDSKRIFQDILDSAIKSRQKDYDDSYRLLTYDSKDEMHAVLGDLDENDFLKELKHETATMREKITTMIGIFSHK